MRHLEPVEGYHHIWIQDKHNDEHYPLGWYFNDETEDLHGPFATLDECKASFDCYCKQLAAQPPHKESP